MSSFRGSHYWEALAITTGEHAFSSLDPISRNGGVEWIRFALNTERAGTRAPTATMRKLHATGSDLTSGDDDSRGLTGAVEWALLPMSDDELMQILDHQGDTWILWAGGGSRVLPGSFRSALVRAKAQAAHGARAD